MDRATRCLDDAMAQAFPQEAEGLRRATEAAWAALAPDVAAARRSRNPLDRRIATCARFLAAIQAMHAAGKDDAAIRAACLEAAACLVRPRNRLHAALKRWPAKAIGTAPMRWVASRLAKKVDHLGYEGGFVARIVTDPAETFGTGYGVDILACGICKLFTRHGMGRYVPILCEVDHLTTSLAGLEMRRTDTIATGASRCEFRYKPLGG